MLSPSSTKGNSEISSLPSPVPPFLPAASQNLPLRYPETLGTLIEVRESPSHGKGIFALVDIPPGTAVLYETPLVVLIDTGTRIDPLDTAVAALSPEDRASFFSLHSYSSNPRESVSRSIVYSNSFAVMDDMHSGVFETGSRFNHSCVPNTEYKWVPQENGNTGRMLYWNKVPLSAGSEVTISYGHNRTGLKRIYGFECYCDKCRKELQELEQVDTEDDTEDDIGEDTEDTEASEEGEEVVNGSVE